MDDYLTKPLLVAALARMLEKWVPAAQGGGPVPAPPVPVQGDTVTAAQPGAVMDFARLQEFRDYDDDALTMTREVIALFMADAPQRLAAMDSAIEAGDRVALAQAAHALKGSAGNVGATAIQQAASEFEALAAQALPSDAAARLARLRELWELTRAALASWP
jgi:HPt (histidine-containing phosphotransfer) domain-containing protein